MRYACLAARRALLRGSFAAARCIFVVAEPKPADAAAHFAASPLAALTRTQRRAAVQLLVRWLDEERGRERREYSVNHAGPGGEWQRTYGCGRVERVQCAVVNPSFHRAKRRWRLAVRGAPEGCVVLMCVHLPDGVAVVQQDGGGAATKQRSFEGSGETNAIAAAARLLRSCDKLLRCGYGDARLAAAAMHATGGTDQSNNAALSQSEEVLAATPLAGLTAARRRAAIRFVVQLLDAERGGQRQEYSVAASEADAENAEGRSWQRRYGDGRVEHVQCSVVTPSFDAAANAWRLSASTRCAGGVALVAVFLHDGVAVVQREGGAVGTVVTYGRSGVTDLSCAAERLLRFGSTLLRCSYGDARLAEAVTQAEDSSQSGIAAVTQSTELLAATPLAGLTAAQRRAAVRSVVQCLDSGRGEEDYTVVAAADGDQWERMYRCGKVERVRCAVVKPSFSTAANAWCLGIGRGCAAGAVVLVCVLLPNGVAVVQRDGTDGPTASLVTNGGAGVTDLTAAAERLLRFGRTVLRCSYDDARLVAAAERRAPAQHQAQSAGLLAATPLRCLTAGQRRAAVRSVVRRLDAERGEQQDYTVVQSVAEAADSDRWERKYRCGRVEQVRCAVVKPTFKTAANAWCLGVGRGCAAGSVVLVCVLLPNGVAVVQRDGADGPAANVVTNGGKGVTDLTAAAERLLRFGRTVLRCSYDDARLAAAAEQRAADAGGTVPNRDRDEDPSCRASHGTNVIAAVQSGDESAHRAAAESEHRLGRRLAVTVRRAVQRAEESGGAQVAGAAPDGWWHWERRDGAKAVRVVCAVASPTRSGSCQRWRVRSLPANAAAVLLVCVRVAEGVAVVERSGGIAQRRGTVRVPVWENTASVTAELLKLGRLVRVLRTNAAALATRSELRPHSETLSNPARGHVLRRWAFRVDGLRGRRLAGGDAYTVRPPSQRKLRADGAGLGGERADWDWERVHSCGAVVRVECKSARLRFSAEGMCWGVRLSKLRPLLHDVLVTVLYTPGGLRMYEAEERLQGTRQIWPRYAAKGEIRWERAAAGLERWRVLRQRVALLDFATGRLTVTAGARTA
eukprot:TRINITY_DN5353_c0_g1_i11.p1 TRINITY_DN5353_c0_g1~~TRINITY_DN5353_c0_g1_i11.p1  ORF type:complete len:1093 (+),score=285.23 TRINITY_DN5353_c0_g1_i11:49-3279(+)